METEPQPVEQHDPQAAFAVAVERFVDTHPDRPRAALADLINCSRANVSQVLQRNGSCPAGWVVKLAAATGVARGSLRPDLYPDEAQQPIRKDEHGEG